MSINERIHKVISEVHKLEKSCYPGIDFKIKFLTIFSQSAEDFVSLRKELLTLGKESEVNNGFKYEFNTTINLAGETIELTRIRKFDVHRPEFGCADLTYDKKDYEIFRDIALQKGFDIILRKDYEMIELSDFNINVYAYLVKDLD